MPIESQEYRVWYEKWYAYSQATGDMSYEELQTTDGTSHSDYKTPVSQNAYATGGQENQQYYSGSSETSSNEPKHKLNKASSQVHEDQTHWNTQNHDHSDHYSAPHRQPGSKPNSEQWGSQAPDVSKPPPNLGSSREAGFNRGLHPSGFRSGGSDWDNNLQSQHSKRDQDITAGSCFNEGSNDRYSDDRPSQRDRFESRDSIQRADQYMSQERSLRDTQFPVREEQRSQNQRWQRELNRSDTRCHDSSQDGGRFTREDYHGMANRKRAHSGSLQSEPLRDFGGSDGLRNEPGVRNTPHHSARNIPMFTDSSEMQYNHPKLSTNSNLNNNAVTIHQGQRSFSANVTPSSDIRPPMKSNVKQNADIKYGDRKLGNRMDHMGPGLRMPMGITSVDPQHSKPGSSNSGNVANIGIGDKLCAVGTGMANRPNTPKETSTNLPQRVGSGEGGLGTEVKSTMPTSAMMASMMGDSGNFDLTAMNRVIATALRNNPIVIQGLIAKMSSQTMDPKEMPNAVNQIMMSAIQQADGSTSNVADGSSSRNQPGQQMPTTDQQFSNQPIGNQQLRNLPMNNQGMAMQQMGTELMGDQPIGNNLMDNQISNQPLDNQAMFGGLSTIVNPSLINNSSMGNQSSNLPMVGAQPSHIPPTKFSIGQQPSLNVNNDYPDESTWVEGQSDAMWSNQGPPSKRIKVENVIPGMNMSHSLGR